MQKFTLTQYAIWILSPVLLLAIALVFYRRRKDHSFRWFIAYLVWVALVSYFQFIIYFVSNPYLFFFSYWIAQAVAVLLSFVALYEVFRNVLTSGTLPVSKSNFVLINALLLAGAALLAYKLEGGDTDRMMYTILVLSRTARFVQVALMLILVALSSFFGFYWSSQAFGIAAGFGLYASIELINSTVRAMLGPNGNKFWSWVSVLSYQLAALIWLAYALRGRKSPVMELPEAQLPRL
jgi:hypothetical protein